MERAAGGVSELLSCRSCGKPYLEGYPHHHETPQRPDYNPMPRRPGDLGAQIAIARREYQLELPVRLHVQYVPGRLEPIGISEYSAAMGGYVATGRSIDVSDTGPLGSPSWSPEAHRRLGGVTVWGDAETVNAGDYAIFPWSYVIERRVPGWCRSRHITRPELYSEHDGRPVCGDLMRAVVIHGAEIDVAALSTQMTLERAIELLLPALGFLWRCVSDALNEIDLRRIA